MLRAVVATAARGLSLDISDYTQTYYQQTQAVDPD
jgi:hypothetical protein